MQRLLLEARDAAVHGFDTAGSLVPESFRQATTAVWNALLAPVLSLSTCGCVDDVAATTWPWPCRHSRTHPLMFMANFVVPSPTIWRSRPCACPCCR